MTTRALATVLSFPLLAAGCGEGGITEPIRTLPRQLTLAEQEIIASANAFGFGLLELVYAAEPGPNVFLSPVSASMALGMTMNGTAGETWDAMSATLGFGGISETDINESYRGLMDMLLDLDPNVTLRIGNSIWSKQGFPFEASFFTTAREYFNAEARELDFDDPASVDVINQWASDATDGRIERVIEQIDPLKIMFLLNALYFKGTWTKQFDPRETQPGPFTRADGSIVDVPMMSMEKARLLHTRTSAYEAIEMAYGGEAFAMTLVLPGPGANLSSLVESMDASAWEKLTADLDSVEIDVRMPRFRLEYEELLNEPLSALGMAIAFTDRADFTRLTPVARERAVCIHFVKQNTFVEVNEEGTEAAAVTSVGVGFDSAPPRFDADRPFLFAIRERLSGTILFIGTIGDPTAEKSAPAEEPRPGCL